MVLNQEKVECSLWLGDESLPQTENLSKFKYNRISLRRDGELDPEMDRRTGASSAVLRALLWSVVVKRELSQKEKLLIYWSSFVPTHTYGHRSA